jgi:uncharacterized membrane protein
MAVKFKRVGTRLKTISKRSYIQAVICLVLFILGIHAVTNISPYREPSVRGPGFQATSQSEQGRTTYVRAEVIQANLKNNKLDLTVTLLDGPRKGDRISTVSQVDPRLFKSNSHSAGDTVVLGVNSYAGKEEFTYYEPYRIPAVGIIILFMLLLVAAVGGKRGLSGIFGLAVSLAILALYIIPTIIAGEDALRVTLIGSFFIVTASIFLAHGFTKRISVAFISTLLTLAVVAALSVIFTKMTWLTGFTSEESIALSDSTIPISLSGIMLSGIIIATLGVLDDITTAQAAAIDELHKANRNFSFQKLIASGMSIGREHISSVINTLALAYVGVSLPSVIIYSLYNTQPLPVLLNSEFIILEVVRSLVASIGLILAVPITTLLAAYILPRWQHARTTD